ncbi:unnamed protein product [Blepharisma stoltei]|uniref:Uncharacterized protein n=1 Tax=Blepharisma stoltei TaxID=1481888 RepID=A0AAU9JR65_9CILI|nr:unnamed protein product [Blepharisma stoltei]
MKFFSLRILRPRFEGFFFYLKKKIIFFRSFWLKKYRRKKLQWIFFRLTPKINFLEKNKNLFVKTKVPNLISSHTKIYVWYALF